MAVEGQLDENSADDSLPTRPFLGIDLFAGFRFDPKQAREIDGTINDVENGKTYRCSMWFEGDEPDVLVARGFIGFSFLRSGLTGCRRMTARGSASMWPRMVMPEEIQRP